MSNGDAEACCAYWICCDHDKAIDALTKRLVRETGVDADAALKIAVFLHDSPKGADLAPRGLIQPLIEYIHEHKTIEEAAILMILQPFIEYVQKHPYRGQDMT